MKHGCVAASAVVAVMFASSPTAAAPLRLQNFLEHGSAGGKPSHHHRHRAAAKPAAQRPTATASAAAAPQPSDDGLAALAQQAVQRAVQPHPAVPAPRLAAKMVPTIAIAAKGLTVVPGAQGVGFSASTEPWSGRSAFAPTDNPHAPSGVRIVPANQLNEIDLAADRPPQPAGAKADRLAEASLVTPANAAEPQSDADGPGPEAARAEPSSFSDWIYSKFADGLVTTALAIRALFR
jgi:hypothetical protein